MELESSWWEFIRAWWSLDPDIKTLCGSNIQRRFSEEGAGGEQRGSPRFLSVLGALWHPWSDNQISVFTSVLIMTTKLMSFENTLSVPRQAPNGFAKSTTKFPPVMIKLECAPGKGWAHTVSKQLSVPMFGKEGTKITFSLTLWVKTLYKMPRGMRKWGTDRASSGVCNLVTSWPFSLGYSRRSF